MAEQATLTPILPAALTAFASMATGTAARITALSMVRVRLKLKTIAGAAVAIRPWYESGGEWWPLRGDGAGGGPAAVTAAPGVLEDQSGYPKAEGYYVTAGLSHPVALVIESGSAADIQAADIEAVVLPTLA